MKDLIELNLVIIEKFSPFGEKHANILRTEVARIRHTYGESLDCEMKINVTSLMTHSEQTLFGEVRIEFSTRIRLLTEAMIELGKELEFFPIILHTHSILECVQTKTSSFEHITRNIRHGSIIITSDNPHPRCLNRKGVSSNTCL